MDTLDPAILLVDDDVHVVTTLVAALRDMGHTMVTCRNGLEAVERAAEREFAVILLDVQMPVMDGFDAAEQIRNDPINRNTPIIFLTGVASSLQKKNLGYSLGAVDYLVKPFDVMELRSKITVFVDLYVKYTRLKNEVRATRAERAAMGEQAAIDMLRNSTVLADLSHELRTPLNAILGFAELLHDSPLSMTQERSREYLGYIIDSSTHLLNLVGDVERRAAHEQTH